LRRCPPGDAGGQLAHQVEALSTDRLGEPSAGEQLAACGRDRRRPQRLDHLRERRRRGTAPLPEQLLGGRRQLRERVLLGPPRRLEGVLLAAAEEPGLRLPRAGAGSEEESGVSTTRT